MADFTRRDFVKFMSGTSLMALGLGGASSLLTSCATAPNGPFVFNPLKPTDVDALKLVDGLSYELVISYDEEMSVGKRFGFNNDFTAFFPFKSKKDEGVLWVNHEAVNPMLMKTMERSKENIDKERSAVGGSLVHLKRDKSGHWRLVKNSKYNRKVDATTKIPFAAGTKVDGSSFAIGTLANCAGGVTPWGTVLTCEENYHSFYGETDFKTGEHRESELFWEKVYKMNPHHYGWVVEVDPFTGKAKKHTTLGRFAHEGATPIRAKDGRIVVYSGDDKAGEFIYKFISSEKDSLEKGELYVADIKNGKWLSLNRESHPELKKTFKNQLELLMHARIAGRIVGATPCDRPEDVEIGPHNADVYVCLTNNKSSANFHGSILRIVEKDGEHTSLEFKAETFLAGGSSTGFSCPDNMAFDKKGNLWMTTDISGGSMNRFPYTEFKNNSLFYIPMSGPAAGVAHRVASAPTDSEFTGLYFDPTGERLFLSVQHPGEKSKNLQSLRSHWPDGGENLPRPAVVQIYGPLFKSLMS
jgi:secreted PhoX family phosphatase